MTVKEGWDAAAGDETPSWMRPLVARSMAALGYQRQVMRRLDEVMRMICGMGFMPLGFSAHAFNAPTIFVAPPTDAVIDALVGRWNVCGKFQRDHGALWLAIEGVRVQWDIEVEPMRRAA
jgi:hypothetical protein